MTENSFFINHILIQKINLHEYLMIKVVHNIFLDKCFIIIHRYVTICNDRLNWCGILIFFRIELILSIFTKSVINYFCWIMMRWYFSLLFFPSIVSLLILIIEHVSVFVCKVMSVLNKLLVWMLRWGRCEFLITLSLFDLFILFDSLLLMFELTVVHVLFLDFYETFLSCFHLNEINNMTISFTFVNYYLSEIKIKQPHGHLSDRC